MVLPVLLCLLATAGCSGDEPGSIPLLRAPHSDAPLTLTMSGVLKDAGGCLNLISDAGLPYSVIFDQAVDVEVTDDELWLDGKAFGPVAYKGLPVEVSGWEGPITYNSDYVTGPIDRACNQTQPIVVKELRVVPLSQLQR